MALIAHLCTKCAHPDIWRLPKTQCGNGPCSCLRCTPGPSELRPTYDQAGQEVERIIKPGDDLHTGVHTCGCAACVELYEQLTAT